MKFPKFWAKATVEEVDERGSTTSFTNWGWSDESEDDAYQKAQASAKRNIKRLLTDINELERYPYGQLPLREEIIERLTDSTGEMTAAVTQNAYGSLVLNTARVMFIDIDFPQLTLGEAFKGFFSKLLNRQQVPPEIKQEAEALERIRLFHKQHAYWGIRIYRTAAGFRLLVTHALFDPTSSETYKLLESAGSDPLYIRLCQAQECFRARLTPKPWRCGHYPDAGGWPFHDEALQLAHEQWQTEYEEKQIGYATCRFVEWLGQKEIHPEVAPLLALHDRFTRCESSLPLA